jgi:hypothetical protein
MAKDLERVVSSDKKWDAIAPRFTANDSGFM